ncbi:thiamine pyrophosphokinase [Kickxella alabastrina]|uniref:Thiamine pyrophosphokinase n=1 Tax=Kickxella alabastrina TaxID=61397 RepID=A0ACC1IAG3_9FUNG|nr:thiamine pyrophosphokinase [Kickxella alabastrina]
MDSPLPQPVTTHLASHLLCPPRSSSDNCRIEADPRVAACFEANGLAVLVLNQPIPHSATIFEPLWRRAQHRFCIDGGANQLHALPHSSLLPPPTAIIGDLDSIIPSVQSHYEQMGTLIQHYSDQDTTDLMKALYYLDTVTGTRKSTVVVFGGLSGRLDHVLSTLKVLFREKDRDMIVVSEENLTMCLPEGKHRVLVSGMDGPACGLLPLEAEAVLTTRGLKWDLQEQPSSFAGLLSTSNVITAKDEIYVETTQPVVWTCQLTSSGKQ